MVRILLLFLFITTVHNCLGQFPTINSFGDSSNERAMGVVELESGSVFLVGSYAPSTNLSQVTLIKTTSQGLPDTTFYLSDSSISFPKAFTVKDNLFYITFETHRGAESVLPTLLVVDTLGNILLEKKYEGAQTKVFSSIRPTLDGNFIITGFTSGTFGSGNDYLIAKTNPQGEILWERTYGSNLNDVATDGMQINPNLFIVTADNKKPDHSYDVNVVGVDSLGYIRWERKLENEYNSGCQKMELSDDGHIYIVGETSTDSSAYFDVYLIKMDTTGNLIWEKSIPESDQGDAGFIIKQVNEGKFIITGYSYNPANETTDAFATFVNAEGELIEKRFYDVGLIDIGYGLSLSKKGGFFISGFGKNGDTDDYLLVFDTLSDISFTTIKNKPYPRINLFPNPSSGNVNFQNIWGQNSVISIRDIKGVLLQEMLLEGVEQINLSSFSNGVYFIEIKQNGHTVATEKLVIIHE
ncbi:MAG: hypothetical protein ACI9WO_002291 [Sphingobacteriales bacterium]|jgi:hypothetical protein